MLVIAVYVCDTIKKTNSNINDINKNNDIKKNYKVIYKNDDTIRNDDVI